MFYMNIKDFFFFASDPSKSRADTASPYSSLPVQLISFSIFFWIGVDRATPNLIDINGPDWLKKTLK